MRTVLIFHPLTTNQFRIRFFFASQFFWVFFFNHCPYLLHNTLPSIPTDTLVLFAFATVFVRVKTNVSPKLAWLASSINDDGHGEYCVACVFLQLAVKIERDRVRPPVHRTVGVVRREGV